LGLAIVRRLVDAHGWRIQAASTPGRGTNMTISGIATAEENA
jgi:signal transduction histidine kinase